MTAIERHQHRRGEPARARPSPDVSTSATIAAPANTEIEHPDGAAHRHRLLTGPIEELLRRIAEAFEERDQRLIGDVNRGLVDARRQHVEEETPDTPPAESAARSRRRWRPRPPSSTRRRATSGDPTRRSRPARSDRPSARSPTPAPRRRPAAASGANETKATEHARTNALTWPKMAFM